MVGSMIPESSMTRARPPACEDDHADIDRSAPTSRATIINRRPPPLHGCRLWALACAPALDSTTAFQRRLPMAKQLTICSGLNEFFDGIREVFALEFFYESLSKDHSLRYCFDGQTTPQGMIDFAVIAVIAVIAGLNAPFHEGVGAGCHVIGRNIEVVIEWDTYDGDDGLFRSKGCGRNPARGSLGLVAQMPYEKPRVRQGRMIADFVSSGRMHTLGCSPSAGLEPLQH